MEKCYPIFSNFGIINSWRAHIRHVLIGDAKTVDYPGKPTVLDANKMPYGVVIRIGNGDPITFHTTVNSVEETMIMMGQVKWICYGVIIYEDIFKRERKTWFCWEYRPELRLRGFYISDNQELNDYT